MATKCRGIVLLSSPPSHVHRHHKGHSPLRNFLLLMCSPCSYLTDSSHQVSSKRLVLPKTGGLCYPWPEVDAQEGTGGPGVVIPAWHPLVPYSFRDIFPGLSSGGFYLFWDRVSLTLAVPELVMVDQVGPKLTKLHLLLTPECWKACPSLPIYYIVCAHGLCVGVRPCSHQFSSLTWVPR